MFIKIGLMEFVSVLLVIFSLMLIHQVHKLVLEKFVSYSARSINLGKNMCRKHDRVSSKSLEEARKSFGTDEDLLLVIYL